MNERNKGKGILLCLLPLWGTDHPYLGLATLYSFLRNKGCSVSQHDFNIQLKKELQSSERRFFFDECHSHRWSIEERFYKEVYPKIKSRINNWARILSNDTAEIIGFSVFCSNKYVVHEVSRKIKEYAPRKTIIVGGPEVSHMRKSYEAIDHYIEGEGELALLKRVRDLSTGVIVNKRRRAVIPNKNEHFINHLDDLPFPSFEGIHFADYKLHDTVPILGSRGCVFRCAFCSESVFWRRYRYRSPGNLFEEIRHQYQQHHTDKFIFLDSLINGNINQLNLLCDLLINSSFKINWAAKACFQKNLTFNVLRKMKSAGCSTLMYGLESGSQEVLDKMNKKFTIEQAETILERTHNAGIESLIFIILGFPTESDFNYRETKSFVKKNHLYIDKIVPGGGCQLGSGDAISKNPNNFGVYWKNENEKYSNNWFSKHTSPAIRNRRVRDFTDFCRNLKMNVLN